MTKFPKLALMAVSVALTACKSDQKPLWTSNLQSNYNDLKWFESEQSSEMSFWGFNPDFVHHYARYDNAGNLLWHYEYNRSSDGVLAEKRHPNGGFSILKRSNNSTQLSIERVYSDGSRNVIWSKPLSSREFIYTETFNIDPHGNHYISTKNTFINEQTLFAINDQGSPLFNWRYDNSYLYCLLPDNRLITSANTGGYRVVTQSGTPLWERAKGSFVHAEDKFYSLGDRLFVVETKEFGKFELVEVDIQTGLDIWRKPAPWRYGEPKLQLAPNGGLYVGYSFANSDMPGKPNITLFDASGTELWTQVMTTPTASSNSVRYSLPHNAARVTAKSPYLISEITDMKVDVNGQLYVALRSLAGYEPFLTTPYCDSSLCTINIHFDELVQLPDTFDARGDVSRYSSDGKVTGSWRFVGAIEQLEQKAPGTFLVLQWDYDTPMQLAEYKL